VRRVRILRVIARMNVGGPALQVTGLTERLDPERFDHRVLVGFVGDDEEDYLDLRAPHLAVTRVPGLGRSPRIDGDVRAFTTLVREMRAFRPDIVHTHTAKAGVLGRLAAEVARVPARVHTFHGHLLHGYFSPTVTRGVVAVERALAHRTTRLVAVGAQVRDDLLGARIGRASQYVVVPPGIALPPAPERAAARVALDLPTDAPVVVFVARLTAVKRPDRFIAMARLVSADHPDARFVVAGEGTLLADMQRDALPLGDRVRFLGWRSDVEVLYAAADVVVLTSDNEGMPVSLIEAASVGRPAVTTDVGSASEVVLDGETGFVTDDAPDSIAAAVGRLLDDAELRDRMGAAAGLHAQQRFGQQRLVDDTASLYEAIVRELDLSRRP
jgi:glycosyltransferase involved in cell wall biosynthesis